ncbi:MAG: ABC transporter permease, partial [Bacillota bacterium]
MVRKELADNLLGSRFVILAGLVFVTTLAGLYVAAQTIRNNVGTGVFDQFVFLKLFTTGDPQRQLPSLVSFLAFFTPLVGLALGFDAINGEESRRTLSRLLAQPIHRDAVINGKFVAGLLTIALMLAGLALLVFGLRVRGMCGAPRGGGEGRPLG